MKTERKNKNGKREKKKKLTGSAAESGNRPNRHGDTHWTFPALKACTYSKLDLMHDELTLLGYPRPASDRASLATTSAAVGTVSAAARAAPALDLAASVALWMVGLSWSCDNGKLELVWAVAACGVVFCLFLFFCWLLGKKLRGKISEGGWWWW